MEGQRTIGTVDESKLNWDGRIALVRPPEGFQGCLEEKMKIVSMMAGRSIGNSECSTYTLKSLYLESAKHQIAVKIKL